MHDACILGGFTRLSVGYADFKRCSMGLLYLRVQLRGI